uniref:Plus3 domain-containing protein n=1 Tax=Parastrongyloides trichosuri TaxID=131310 RepID=A0A0N4ZRD6_PARTI
MSDDSMNDSDYDEKIKQMHNYISSELDSDEEEPQTKKVKTESKATKRKSTATKRINKRARKDDSSDDEYGHTLDGVDESLIINDEDRRKLASMNELDREEEMLRRYEERRLKQEMTFRPSHVTTVNENYTINSSDDEDESLKVRTKARYSSDEGEITPDTAFHLPSEVNEKQEKKNALKEFRQKRKEKLETEEKKQKEVLDVSETFGNDGNESDSSSNSSTSSISSPRSLSRRRSSRDSRSRSKSEEYSKEIDTVGQLSAIVVTRQFLSKHCHAPFFAKSVIGCFVRVGIGHKNGVQVYRVTQIENVEEGNRIYNLENTRTNLTLKLKFGKDLKVYRMEFVSNTPITDEEFGLWKNNMRQYEINLPSEKFIENKKKDIDAVTNHQYTEEDANYIVNQKNKFRDFPTNFAYRKGVLLREKVAASNAGDFDKVRSIEEELAVIERRASAADKKRSAGVDAIQKINIRNRETMSSIFLSNNAPVEMPNEDDPFTRKSSKMPVVSGRSKVKKENGSKNDIIDKNRRDSLTKGDCATTFKNKEDMLKAIDIDISDL